MVSLDGGYLDPTVLVGLVYGYGEFTFMNLAKLRGLLRRCCAAPPASRRSAQAIKS